MRSVSLSPGVLTPDSMDLSSFSIASREAVSLVPAMPTSFAHPSSPNGRRAKGPPFSLCVLCDLVANSLRIRILPHRAQRSQRYLTADFADPTDKTGFHQRNLCNPRFKHHFSARGDQRVVPISVASPVKCPVVFRASRPSLPWRPVFFARRQQLCRFGCWAHLGPCAKIKANKRWW